MHDINYVHLTDLNPDDLISLLNKPRLRTHLIDHPLFDRMSIDRWIQDKCVVDRIDGCRVRGIVANGNLAGWCGIQRQDAHYEIAIVLDDKYWGLGKNVFNDLFGWAKELGHAEVVIHLLHTRPDYRFLHKLARQVYTTSIAGHTFTTYQIAIT